MMSRMCQHTQCAMLLPGVHGVTGTALASLSTHSINKCSPTNFSLFVQILEESFLDSTTTTPIYFILSPGANVVGDLDKLADKYDFVKNESYHNVSMGQGQV